MKSTTTLKVITSFLVLYSSDAFSCVTSKRMSGNSCDQLKVEFNDAGCPVSKFGRKSVTSTCSASGAVATYVYGNTQWTAKFAKSEGSWGEVQWKKKGPLLESQLDAKVSPPVASYEETRKPTNESGPTQSPLAFKLSGYLDFRLNGVTNKDNPNSTRSGNQESGFNLEESALYVSAEQSDFSFYFDLPLRREKGTDNESNNANFVVGGDRAQAILKFPLFSSMNLSFGQFDTPYGVELNDSKDRTFGKTGLLYDYALPVTHTGLLIDGGIGVFNYKALAANSNNKGSFGSSSDGDNQMEAGVTLGYAGATYRAQFGYLTRAIKKADDTHGGKRSLLDITIGGTWGPVSVDAEWSQVDSDRKNTLTAGDTSDKEDAGQVFLLLPTVKVGDSWLLGVRYESLTNDPSGATATAVFKDATSAGLTAHYQYNAHLKFRAEFIKTEYESVGGAKGDQTRGFLMGLFSF